jgi:hypothetical protein
MRRPGDVANCCVATTDPGATRLLHIGPLNYDAPPSAPALYLRLQKSVLATPCSVATRSTTRWCSCDFLFRSHCSSRLRPTALAPLPLGRTRTAFLWNRCTSRGHSVRCQIDNAKGEHFRNNLCPANVVGHFGTGYDCGTHSVDGKTAGRAGWPGASTERTVLGR